MTRLTNTHSEAHIPRHGALVTYLVAILVSGGSSCNLSPHREASAIELAEALSFEQAKIVLNQNHFFRAIESEA